MRNLINASSMEGTIFALLSYTLAILLQDYHEDRQKNST